MTIDISTLSLDQLKRAVALKEQIAALESQLAGLLGGAKATVTAPAPGKRSLSAATRAKMAAGRPGRSGSCQDRSEAQTQTQCGREGQDHCWNQSPVGEDPCRESRTHPRQVHQQGRGEGEAEDQCRSETANG